MGLRGGKRDGAGRKPGSSNLPKIRDFMSEKDAKEVVSKAMELVRGIKARKVVKGKEIIYDVPPNGFVAIKMMENFFGTPPKAVLEDDSGERVADVLVEIVDYADKESPKSKKKKK